MNTDRWLFWPTFASLGIVGSLALICGIPGVLSFVMIPVSALSLPIAFAVLLVMSVILAVKRRPRRAASILLALAIPIILWRPINWVADCVHLGMTVGIGAGELGTSSRPDGNGFEAYDWSVGLAGANTFLIHDETDQIALPLAKSTHPSASEDGFVEECAGNVLHLLGHYYVCSF